MLKRVLGAALMLVAVTVAMPVVSASAVTPPSVAPSSFEWPGCC
jgi:hypothetical protein